MKNENLWWLLQLKLRIHKIVTKSGWTGTSQLLILSHSDWFALPVEQSATTSEWPMDSDLKPNPASTVLLIRNNFYSCISPQLADTQIGTTITFNRFISRYKSVFLIAFLLLLFRERLIPWPCNIIFLFDFLTEKTGPWRNHHYRQVSFIRKLFIFLSFLSSKIQILYHISSRTGVFISSLEDLIYFIFHLRSAIIHYKSLANKLWSLYSLLDVKRSLSFLP